MTTTVPKTTKLATPSGMESLEQLAALMIRARTYEARGLTPRTAILTAAADFRANPAAVLSHLRGAAGAR